jgi:diadenosine tetraphosphate (Ap4A) HIT family hydrolase
LDTVLYTKLMALPEKYGGLDAVQGDLMYLMGCRSFDQFVSTLRGLIDPEHHCPFCTDERNSKTPFGWFLKPNDFPLKSMRAMLLAIPNRHITDAKQLQPSDWVALGGIFERASREHAVEGGGVVMRFGDARYHSGTIPHVHFNIICPSGEQEYRIPLSKNAEDREENYKRLLSHRDELLKKGGLEYLFPVL